MYYSYILQASNIVIICFPLPTPTLCSLTHVFSYILQPFSCLLLVLITYFPVFLHRHRFLRYHIETPHMHYSRTIFNNSYTEHTSTFEYVANLPHICMTEKNVMPNGSLHEVLCENVSLFGVSAWHFCEIVSFFGGSAWNICKKCHYFGSLSKMFVKSAILW